MMLSHTFQSSSLRVTGVVIASFPGSQPVKSKTSIPIDEATVKCCSALPYEIYVLHVSSTNKGRNAELNHIASQDWINEKLKEGRPNSEAMTSI